MTRAFSSQVPALLLALVLMVLAIPAAAFAEATVPLPYLPQLATQVMHWGGFPTPVGPVADAITWLYNIIFIIVAVIMLLVVAALGYIMWRYRAANVATPATFSHSMKLELLWTIIPALICVFIAYESAQALFRIRTMPAGAMNVEVVAYQFGWNFYYPDFNGTDASGAQKKVAAPEPTENDPEVSLPDAPRLTKTMVVPVGRPVVLHVTAQDVLHAFFLPHLGIKMDAIPGRINYAWFTADAPGDWLGQCAELCGQAHGEMFFRVKAVPQAEFDAFIAAQRAEAGIVVQPVSATLVSTTVVPLVSSSQPALPAAVNSATLPVTVSATVSATL